MAKRIVSVLVLILIMSAAGYAAQEPQDIAGDESYIHITRVSAGSKTDQYNGNADWNFANDVLLKGKLGRINEGDLTQRQKEEWNDTSVIAVYKLENPKVFWTINKNLKIEHIGPDDCYSDFRLSARGSGKLSELNYFVDINTLEKYPPGHRYSEYNVDELAGKFYLVLKSEKDVFSAVTHRSYVVHTAFILNPGLDFSSDCKSTYNPKVENMEYSFRPMGIDVGEWSGTLSGEIQYPEFTTSDITGYDKGAIFLDAGADQDNHIEGLTDDGAKRPANWKIKWKFVVPEEMNEGGQLEINDNQPGLFDRFLVFLLRLFRIG